MINKQNTFNRIDIMPTKAKAKAKAKANRAINKSMRKRTTERTLNRSSAMVTSGIITPDDDVESIDSDSGSDMEIHLKASAHTS